MRQAGITATILNLGNGGALPARDSIGRHVVVPKSCLAAVLRGNPFEPGITVTDENGARKLTMVRIDTVDNPHRETFVARLTHRVTQGSSYTHLDSAHGVSSVFVAGGIPGFPTLSTLHPGDHVTVNALRAADGKWTAQSLVSASLSR